MSDSCQICNCIEPILIALACAEAMEHNALVGKEIKSIGENIKRLVSSEEYEDLTFEHGWLEYPLTEPLARIAFAVSMRDIREKCNTPTDEVRKMFMEAADANEKKQFGAAQQKFIDVKSKILNLATELCKSK